MRFRRACRRSGVSTTWRGWAFRRRPGTPATYVTILPETTWINGNTARAEVLAACVPGLGLDQARRVLGERDRGRWFLNRGDFVNRLNMPQLQAQSVKVGITSDWFLLTAYARRDRQEVRLQALVQRKAGESTAVNWMRVGS